jgi:hypothetical protein
MASPETQLVVPDDELHRQLNDVEREMDTLQDGRPMYEITARDAL